MNKGNKAKGGENMEVRIKISVNTTQELEERIKEIREIEKEHNCNCTLLDVTVTH